MKTFRLRHILVRHQEQQPVKGKPAGSKPKATRSRDEAEAILRSVLRDMREEVKKSGKVPKNANDIVVMQNKKFSELCREHSECSTAQKGGTMCGDLGWLSLEEMTNFGG